MSFGFLATKSAKLLKRKLATGVTPSVSEKQLCLRTTIEAQVGVKPINPTKLSLAFPELNYDPEETDRVIVYTDGSCKTSPKFDQIAGFGVFWGLNSWLNVSEKYEGVQTNNRAEIAAVVRAVEIAQRSDIKKLLVRTDSQFTINCMTSWIGAWKRNEWRLKDGSDVKCRDVLEKLDNLIMKTGINIKWKHVAAHRGEWGNTWADHLANKGAEQWLNQ